MPYIFSALPFSSYSLARHWILGALLAGTMGGTAQAQFVPPSSNAPAPSTADTAVPTSIRPMSFAPLVRKVAPAVVNIAVTEDLSHPNHNRHVPPSVKGTPFEKKYRERMRSHHEETLGAGSGFIVDAAGYIVTNSHVVGDADKITVSLADGSSWPAKIVGSDILTDIAVIKVNAPHALPFVTWGDSRKLNVGDWVIAAGNPFGLGSSVTAGIVSARGRDIGSGPFDDFLQLDAPINPGNSGGPSFNMAGEIIAVNTAIVSPTGSSVGIGFGIPSEIVHPIVTELIQNGHIDRGWLGITLEDSNAHEGVKILGVDKNGPAQKAGLRKNDIVLSLQGERVETARSLIRSIAALHPTTETNVQIKRNGKVITVPIIIGHRPVDADN